MMKNEQSPFNNYIEYGLRSLFILYASYPDMYSLERIQHLDYIIVHSGDFNSHLKSLHAPTPHRKNEIFIRRYLVQNGLSLFSKLGLVQPIINENGIVYGLTDDSVPYLDSLSEEYTIQVKTRARWAVNFFKFDNTIELRGKIRNSLESSIEDIAFHTT